MRVIYTWCFVLIFGLPNIVLGTRKYFMEDQCGDRIDMVRDRIPAGRLLLTRNWKYSSMLSCSLTIVVPSDKRLVIVFKEIYIEWEPNCDDDFLQIFDGEDTHAQRIQGLPARICGNQRPEGSYVTSGNTVTIFFHSDIYKQADGFSIVFTAFRQNKDRSCIAGDFLCNNGRCIAASLECDDNDNCGDESDECNINSETVFALTISVMLVTVIGVGGIAAYKKHKKQSRIQSNAKVVKSPLCRNTYGCRGAKETTDAPQLPATFPGHTYDGTRVPATFPCYNYDGTRVSDTFPGYNNDGTRASDTFPGYTNDGTRVSDTFPVPGQLNLWRADTVEGKENGDISYTGYTVKTRASI